MLSVVTSKDANGGLITKVEALTKEEYNKRKNSRMTTMTSLDEAKRYLAFGRTMLWTIES